MTAAAEKVGHLAAVTAAVRNFEAVQSKYRDYGARDSEPTHVFQAILQKVIDGNDAQIPQTGDGWELYTSSMDCAEAASALHLAALGAVQAIFACPIRESKAVRAYVRDYCW